MRSIPALYKNQSFASRLECRWAYWWDALGIPWAYEPEVLSLDGETPLTYIPDFYLPTLRCWVEIKGEVVDDAAGMLIIEKCRRLAVQSDRPIILCFDQPFDPKCAVFHGPKMHLATWTMCRHCGSVAIGIRNGAATTIRCPDRSAHDAALGLTAIRQRSRFLYEAAVSARQARFGWPRKKSA